MTEPKSKKSQKMARKIKALETYERSIILIATRNYKEALKELNTLTNEKNRIDPWLHVLYLVKMSDCLMHLLKTSAQLMFTEQQKQIMTMALTVMDIKPKLVYNAAVEVRLNGDRSFQALVLFDCAAELYIVKGSKGKAWKGVLSCLDKFREIVHQLIAKPPTKFTRGSIEIILHEQTRLFGKLTEVRGRGQRYLKHRDKFTNVIKDTTNLGNNYLDNNPYSTRGSDESAYCSIRSSNRSQYKSNRSVRGSRKSVLRRTEEDILTSIKSVNEIPVNSLRSPRRKESELIEVHSKNNSIKSSRSNRRREGGSEQSFKDTNSTKSYHESNLNSPVSDRQIQTNKLLDDIKIAEQLTIHV